ncbi:MAG: imidazoleglycerol-phosphate dehydratase HisB [Chloroflexota bacterium]
MNLQPRQATAQRETRETRVAIRLVIDGRGEAQVSTGIGMLDHLLSAWARHGLFDLKVQAEGDLEVDPHHTAEDVALVLGRAFRKALGDGAGIRRIAEAYAPMDEALALAVVDISGRPYWDLRLKFDGPAVGGIPVGLIGHFWRSFAAEARVTLHCRLLAGTDDHHRAEAVFKAVGRALSRAAEMEPRRAGEVPSTKGLLDL